MVIGLDLDRTLIKPVVENHLLACFKLKVSNIPKVRDFWYSNLPEEVREEIFRNYRNDFYMNKFMLPIPGSAEKIKEWHEKGHKMVIITARDDQGEEIRKGTVKLVNRLFPQIKIIEFTDMRESKETLMEKHALDIWCDDAPHGIKTALSLGIKCYMINTAFNKEYDLGVPKIDSIGEINV